MQSESMESNHYDFDEKKMEDDDDNLSDLARETGESKKYLRALKRRNQATLAFHTAREAEFAEIWRDVQQRHSKGEQGAMLDLSCEHYYIYSSQWMNVWPSHLELLTRPYVEFYSEAYLETGEPGGFICGHFYFTPDNGPHINLFDPPKRASGPPIQLTLMEAKRFGEAVSFTFVNQFILRMEIPKEVVFTGKPPAGTPDMLEFVGVSWNFGEERIPGERKRREDALKSFWETKNRYSAMKMRTDGSLP